MSWLYDRWLGLLTAATVNSVVQALYVHWNSFGNKELLALGGNSGNFIYDVSQGKASAAINLLIIAPLHTVLDGSTLEPDSFERSQL
jgi:hypothetical protein